MPSESALAKAKALIESNGWTVTGEDRGKGMLQAMSHTSVFRFEDDVVIRVRGSGNESVIDIRSRSRVGRGDRGVNAKRIRSFLDAMRAA
jgi:uncharacterized protein (DUF1499 family)